MTAPSHQENAMRRRLSMILLCAPALLAAGCTGTANRSLDSVHQPVVSRTDYVFDVVTDGGGVSQAEMQRLVDWMAALRV
ncbi:MAG: pilus assembly protein CpaD, partial [Sphingomonas hengshuiensis]